MRSTIILFFLANIRQGLIGVKLVHPRIITGFGYLAAITINTRPIALHPQRSNLSLVDVSQKTVVDIFSKFRLDSEYFYQKEIGGFHVTSSRPCWWTRTIAFSLATFVRPPAFVHFTIVICFSREFTLVCFISKITYKTYQCKFYLIVPEEGWFGQPKYSTPSKILPTLYRSLLLYFYSFKDGDRYANFHSLTPSLGCKLFLVIPLTSASA